jgi:hypothetical protein
MCSFSLAEQYVRLLGVNLLIEVQSNITSFMFWYLCVLILIISSLESDKYVARERRVKSNQQNHQSFYLISTTLWVGIIQELWLKYLSLGRWSWFGKILNIYALFCWIICKIEKNFAVYFEHAQVDGWFWRVHTVYVI